MLHTSCPPELPHSSLALVVHGAFVYSFFCVTGAKIRRGYRGCDERALPCGRGGLFFCDRIFSGPRFRGVHPLFPRLCGHPFSFIIYYTYCIRKQCDGHHRHSLYLVLASPNLSSEGKISVSVAWYSLLRVPPSRTAGFVFRSG